MILPPRRIRRLVAAGLGLLWCAAAHADHYTLPLLLPSGTTGEPQGVLRILNGTDESGTVEIHAIDDAGTRSGPATFTLNASAAAEFSASDLVSGNAMKGLTGSIGTLSGDVRLEIDTDLQIIPTAYVRAADGTLSTMHDSVRASAASGGGYEYLVPIFNPSTEMTQESRLRLINPGDAQATVTVEAADDEGTAASGGRVELTLAGGAARTLTAQQLEAGDTGLTGRLGAGVGNWRLNVSSDEPIQVLNVVSSTSGYVNNLSTTAVAGSAPANHEAFNERIPSAGIELRTDTGDFTFTAGAGDRFTETGESDGMAVSSTGSYAYEAIGPDAGRLALSYDGGEVCAANLYFASLTSGWFASHCSGSDHPAEGTWLGGSWSVEDADDMSTDPGAGESGDARETLYGAGEEIADLPTGSWIPDVTANGQVTISGGNTVVRLNEGGYVEEGDYRYTCRSAGGCELRNREVVSGTIAQQSTAAMPEDSQPSFAGAGGPGNPSYTVGTAIDTLTLPAASGGDGALTYSLSPSVPGLTYSAATRQLSGTPSAAGTYAMTYTVTDEDGDTDSLSFIVTVIAGTSVEGSLGVCQVGMQLTSGQSCTYPGTADEFSVNARGRGSFLGRLAGIRIRIDSETIDGRVYDFEASHQGDGVWRIDRLAGSTVPTAGDGTDTGGTVPDTSPSFAAGSGPGNRTYTVGAAIDTFTLPEASGGDGVLTYSLTPSVAGLTFNAATRQLTGTPTAAGPYAMTYTAADSDGDTDTLSFTITVEASGSAVESFDLQTDDGNNSPAGMVQAGGRFYVLDSTDRKVYAYSASGQREPAADFDLHGSNANSEDITHANGRFYVLDWLDDRVYAYSATGQRDEAAEFDLHDDNSRGDAIAYHNGRFHVSDWLADKVFAYTESGQRDEAADFELVGGNPHTEAIVHANGRLFVLDGTSVYAFSESGERVTTADFRLQGGSGDPVGMTHANGRFYVVDESDDKVYAYSASGQRVPTADFDLTVAQANTDPAGITVANGRFHVLDDADDRVYAYSVAGTREAAADFDLHADNASPEDIAYGNGQFYVLDDSDDKVYAYSTSGQRNAAAEFDLHDDNARPGEMTFANNRFYVVDDTDDKVYAYSVSGQRDAASDFGLHAVNASPFGIVYVNDRFHVLDGWDDEVYAYWTTSGQRDAASDFDLHDDNGSGVAITVADGRFYVVDANDDKVYSYPVPVDPDGPDLMAHSATASASQLDTGASFTIGAAVRNRGNQPAGATTLRYYRSADAIISTSDTEIGAGAVGALSAGATSNESIGLTAPGENACYFCGACVDAADGESTTSNNCSNSVLIAVGEQADLRVSRTVLHAPFFATLGVTTIRLTVDVTNDGTVASPPAKLNFSGGRSFSVDIPALAPGETVTFERQNVGTAQLGTTTYRACVDFPCDTDPQNNCGFRSESYFLSSAPDGQMRRTE